MRVTAVLPAIAAVALAGCSTVDYPNDLADIQPTENLMAAVYSPARPAEDVARDEARQPLETVAFAGVRRGQVIAELAPGGGYYTRILAQAVGPDGKVYAMVPARFARAEGGLDTMTAIAEQYGNVEIVVVEAFNAENLPEPVDLVWTTENYHDLAGGEIVGAIRALRMALKPGGIFYVEDHSAPGTGLDALPLHRIDPAAVIQQVTRNGFSLEARSDHLANPADPHTQSPFDYDGVTDKFALRFRRD